MASNKSRRRLPGYLTRQAMRKGRSSYLLRLRDIHLVRRFWEISEVQRLRTDDVLAILSTQEFFISEQRIWSILRRNTDLLDKLTAGEPIELPAPCAKMGENNLRLSQVNPLSEDQSQG